MAATPDQKRALAEKSGAIAVDMESAQVAEWAEESDVPLLAIRTISDTLDDRIPPETAGMVDPKGKLLLRKILFLIMSRPSLFKEIVRLKRNLDFSLQTLEKIVTALIRHP